MKPRQAVREPKKNEMQYESLLEMANVGVITVGPTGELIFVNRTLCKMMGYSKKELVGRRFSDFIHPGEKRLMLRALQNAFKEHTIKPCLEFQTIHKKGRTLHLQCKPTVFIHKGRLMGFHAVLLDITERKETEEIMKKIEGQYRLLTENTTDVIWIVNMNMEFTYVNLSVTSLLGYTVEEALLKKMDELFTPPSFDSIMKSLAEGLHGLILRPRDSLIPQVLELRINRKDGSAVPVEITYSFLHGSFGEPEGILMVGRDITERVQVEKKLQQLYGTERNLRRKIEEEMNKRIEFTRALVHELRTPITPVLASSELLFEQLEEGPLRALAQNIWRSASSLNQRVDELLDLAKSEIGTLQLNLKILDPLLLLQEIVDNEKLVALRNGQSLRLESPPSLSAVNADEDRLRQVLLNLVTNALKFTPAGGKITLRAKEDNAYLVIEVEDTGPGISAEEQQWLFQPYRCKQDVGMNKTGLGLGLTLSKKLVELHGGLIWVKSKPRGGSTFTFTVPLDTIHQKGTTKVGLIP